MVSHRWIGHAATVKQVATIVVANTWAQNDTFTLTCDNIDFVITIGTLVTTAQVATTIKQAINGETLTDTSASCTIPVADGGAQAIGQFAEVVASVASSTVTLTARTAGKPFTFSKTDTTAGTGDTTLTLSATAATGRNHINNVDNLSGNAALLDSDTLTLDDGSVDILHGLSLAVQLATINKYKSYTGNVGLPAINKDNNTTTKHYGEYRTPRYLTTDDNTATTTANLELGEGQGSSRFMWDAGAGQVVLNIFGQGRRVDNVPCILFKGTHASNEVNNINGDLAIAYYAGETATIPTLRTGDGPASQAKTWCGSGVTLTTVTVNGGQQNTDSAITTAVQNGGVWYHNSGTITALTVAGGVFYPMGSATITTLTIPSGGTFDCRKGTDTFAITNTVQMYKGSSFYDPQGRAGNVVFKLNNCTLADVTIVLATNKTYTLS